MIIVYVQIDRGWEAISDFGERWSARRLSLQKSLKKDE
jgi:hypothetical protein